MSAIPAEVRARNSVLVRRGLAVVVAGGAVAVLVSTIVAGADGALGAAVALVLVVAFYGTDVWLMRWTAPMEPVAVFGIVVMAYLFKLTVLALFLVGLRGTDLFSLPAFAATVVGVTSLALLVAVWLSTKATTFIDPDATPPVFVPGNLSGSAAADTDADADAEADVDTDANADDDPTGGERS